MVWNEEGLKQKRQRCGQQEEDNAARKRREADGEEGESKEDKARSQSRAKGHVISGQVKSLLAGLGRRTIDWLHGLLPPKRLIEIHMKTAGGDFAPPAALSIRP